MMTYTVFRTYDWDPEDGACTMTTTVEARSTDEAIARGFLEFLEQDPGTQLDEVDATPNDSSEATQVAIVTAAIRLAAEQCPVGGDTYWAELARAAIKAMRQTP